MPIPAKLVSDRPCAPEYLEMLEALTAGSFHWVPGKDRVEWSPKLHNVLGYPTSDGRPLLDFMQLLHPDDRARQQNFMDRLWKADARFEEEVRLKNASGQYQYFLSRGFWTSPPEKNVRCLVGFLIEITETAQLRIETERSAKLFKAFFDNAPLAAFIKDGGYQHHYGNSKAAELAGVTLSEFLAKRTDDIFGLETAEALAATDEKVIENQETIEWTGQIKTAEGEDLFVLDTKFPIKDPESGEIMVGGIGIDITRQHNAELALAKSQRLEALGQLVAGVAHDFNNTLAVIQGTLDLLPTAKNLDEHDLRQDAQDAIENGARLTKQLLAFARQSPLATTQANLNTLVKNLNRILQRTFSKNIIIEITAKDDLWNTELDVPQVENALLNLALNARDAMSNGGTLTISTSNVWVGQDDVDMHDGKLSAGPYVLLTVADTGSGMSPEELERAFEPFYTTKPIGEGTGMGLAMVHGLVHQFNGTADISSKPDAGTIVRLFFPASRSPAAVSKHATGTGIANGSERILFVEDDDKLRRVLELGISSLGYRVTSAPSGDAALRLLRDGLKIDLLLTDVVMPGRLMGTGLAEQARHLTPGLPVIYLSGYPAEAHTHLHAAPAGGPLLLKPVSLRSLSDEIRRILDPHLH